LLADTDVLLRFRSGRAALARLGADRYRLTPDAATWSVVHPEVGDGWELLAERSHRTVEIRGGGRIGLAVASSLAATGIGTVRMVDDAAVDAGDVAPGGATPSDVGTDLPDVARQVIARATGRDDADPGSAPDLVVLIDRAAADAARADRLLAQDVPHLSVVIRETSVLVGPLVLPGRGPCLRCLDLHRSERDRQWPLVLAQLLSVQARRNAPREETATAQLSAALAVLQVIGQLDGRHTPAAMGATLEVELPDGLVSRRPWPAHAACGCHWPPRAAPETGPATVGEASLEQ
jgi:bacteriocin biosynthesis cyclodehydratase domain-containing protein